MAYFDNLGRDLGIFTIFGSVATIGRQGTHYELLVIPLVYIVVGIFIEMRRKLQKEFPKKALTTRQAPSTSQEVDAQSVMAETNPIIAKPHIRLKSSNPNDASPSNSHRPSA